MLEENNIMVGILILNYNNWEDTINCIESVEEYNTASIKYIIIDNGSTREGTIEALDDYLSKTFVGEYKKVSENNNGDKTLPYITFLTSKTNDGYARGNNKGLRLAYNDDEIDDIMILNNDILFIQDIIPMLLKKRSGIDDCGIISPILYGRDGRTIDHNCARKSVQPSTLILAYLVFYQDLFGILSRDMEKRLIIKKIKDFKTYDRIEVELPSGSCMLISKSLMQKIGGFDPHTFLYYEEDILYSKLKDKSKKNYLDTGCKCIHLGACSTSKTPSAFALTKQFESSIYYLENYCNLSCVQKILLGIGKRLFRLKLKMISILKK